MFAAPDNLPAQRRSKRSGISRSSASHAGVCIRPTGLLEENDKTQTFGRSNDVARVSVMHSDLGEWQPSTDLWYAPPPSSHPAWPSEDAERITSTGEDCDLAACGNVAAAVHARLGPVNRWLLRECGSASSHMGSPARSPRDFGFKITSPQSRPNRPAHNVDTCQAPASVIQRAIPRPVHFTLDNSSLPEQTGHRRAYSGKRRIAAGQASAQSPRRRQHLAPDIVATTANFYAD